MRKYTDRNGVLIEPYDLLKVFHFVGARRKKHYMYKFVIEKGGKLMCSHLNKYPVQCDFTMDALDQKDIEIIQTSNWEKLK